MNKGPIIYLNGVTSAGKTMIAEVLRKYADFYYLSDDIFEDHIAPVPEYDTPGYWEKLAEAVFLMYHTAVMLSDQGKTVVVDSMLMESGAFAPHYARMQAIFKENPLFVVDVFCPLEICRQRNLARPDRLENQSAQQAALMAKDVRYDLHLDTSCLSADQCARRILSALGLST